MTTNPRRLDPDGVLQRDEWLVGRRYLSEHSMALVLGERVDAVPEPEALPAPPA